MSLSLKEVRKTSVYTRMAQQIQSVYTVGLGEPIFTKYDLIPLCTILKLMIRTKNVKPIRNPDFYQKVDI